MKRFFVKISVYLLGIVLAALIIDWIISSRFFDSNDYKFAAWNDIINGGMDNDIVIMGSSRAWVHISPAIIDSILNTKSYNIGIDGACIESQITRYNLYRYYNKKPQVILQNVDWASTLENEANEQYLIQQYLPYFYNKGMRKEVLPNAGFKFMDMYIPLLRYIRYWNLYDAYICADITEPVVRGYRGFDRKWDGKRLEAIDTLHFSYYNESKELFCKYVKQCRDENIKVVFVYSPCYIGATSKVDNIQEFYDVFDSIATQYECIILDYFHSPICYDTTYFYNAMHLNKIGSEIFSTTLAHDLDSLHLFEK
ncbi:MAG: hypothetical protein J6T63_06450 [Bacteroidales bacterium]|nr:hypothetical protein [Bacteroidales bacterium]